MTDFDARALEELGQFGIHGALVVCFFFVLYTVRLRLFVGTMLESSNELLPLCWACDSVRFLFLRLVYVQAPRIPPNTRRVGGGEMRAAIMKLRLKFMGRHMILNMFCASLEAKHNALLGAIRCYGLQ